MGKIEAKENQYTFGIRKDRHEMAGPAELLLGAFAACCLKNVERFSSLLGFEYTNAKIQVEGVRQEKPPMMSEISYTLRISGSDERLNPDLLHKNIRKFGTVYNTLSQVSAIHGKIITD
jgi:uncharacterized OsmC-like protein